MTDTSRITLDQAGKNFVAALIEDPAVIGFRAAKAALDRDPDFVRLTESYNTQVQSFQKQQTEGTLTQADVDGLRELQSRINSHPAAQRFIAAREEIAALVHDCNQEMSTVLGFDFAAVAGPRGGCSC